MTTTLIAPLLDPQMREPREELLSVDSHLQDRRQDPLDFPEDPPKDLQEDHPVDHQEDRLADPLDLRPVDLTTLPKADHTYPGPTRTTRLIMHHPGLTTTRVLQCPSLPSLRNRRSLTVPTPTPSPSLSLSSSSSS